MHLKNICANWKQSISLLQNKLLQLSKSPWTQWKCLWKCAVHRWHPRNLIKQKKYLTYESSNHINVKKYPILYLSILYHTSSKEKKKQTNKVSNPNPWLPPKNGNWLTNGLVPCTRKQPKHGKGMYNSCCWIEPNKKKSNLCIML